MSAAASRRPGLSSNWTRALSCAIMADGVLIILGNLPQQRIHLLCRTAFIGVMFLGQYLVARVRFCPEALLFGFAVFWCPCRLPLSEYFIDVLLAIAS